MFLKTKDFSSSRAAVLAFEPAAFLINKGAEKLWADHKIGARCLCALQYFTNPIDRAIQFIVTPLFVTLSFIYQTHATACKKPRGGRVKNAKFVGYLGLRAVALLPCVAGKTFFIWVALTTNALIHLFPFKVISACKDERPANFFHRRELLRFPAQGPTYPVIALLASDRFAAKQYRSLLDMKK